MKENQVNKLKDLQKVQKELKNRLADKLFYYDDVKNSSIDELKFLGEIEIDGKIEPVYHYVENTEKIENSKKVGIYYTKEHKVLARDFGKQIAIEDDFLEKDYNQILEQLYSIKDNNGITLEDLENDYIKEMVESLGVEKDKLKKIYEIDLNQKYELEEHEKEKECIEEEEELENITYTTKDVNIKQEINTNEMANDVKTIGQKMASADHKLAKQLQGCIKLGIIESDEMRSLEDENGKKLKSATSRYSIVAIRPDGQVIPLNLEQDSSMGSNPMKESYYQETDGDVRIEKPEAAFSIGNTNLMIENGPAGEIEIYYGQKDRTSNEKIGMQLRTENVINKTRTEYRGAVVQEYDEQGEDAVENAIEEANIHKNIDGQNEYDDGKVKIADSDGDKKTKTHGHVEKTEKEILEEKIEKEIDIEDEYIPETDITWGQLANETGETVAVLVERFYREKEINSYSSEATVDEIREDYDRAFENHTRNR